MLKEEGERWRQLGCENAFCNRRACFYSNFFFGGGGGLGRGLVNVHFLSPSSLCLCGKSRSSCWSQGLVGFRAYVFSCHPMPRW